MSRSFVRLHPAMVFLFVGFAAPLQAQNISSLQPEMQLVGGFIEITGNGFGPNQGGSEVIFTDGATTWSGGRAYIWRDDFIRIGVPVGKTEAGSALPIGKGPLEAFVQTSIGISNSHDFRVITADGAGLDFRQLTEISGGHDVSTVLGAPNENDARTKDAEASDVNGDGWVDLTESMNLVSTTIKTFDNKMMVVPNYKIWGDTITNSSIVGERRVDLVFGIGYENNIDRAMEILEEIVTEPPLVLKSPERLIKLHALADSSVNLVCRPWSLTKDYWTVHWDVTGMVKDRFDAAGIGIPYPQRDVHLYVRGSSDGGQTPASISG